MKLTDTLLARVNRSYNDHPKTSPAPRRTNAPVLFLDEADRFVSELRGLPRATRVAVMKDLSRRTQDRDVLVTYNAASVLNTYARELTMWQRVKRADISY